MKQPVLPRGEFWKLFSKLFGLEDMRGIQSLKVVIDAPDEPIMLEMTQYVMIDDKYYIDKEGNPKLKMRKYCLSEKGDWDDPEDVIYRQVEEDI